MALTGATGYDAVGGAGAPSSSLTDFSLYVEFDPSADWWTAFDAHDDVGRIRVTSADGTTEYARDVLATPTASKVMLRVKWAGAQTGTPSVRVYPDATGAYAVTDTYGQYAAYDSNWAGYWPLSESPDGGANAIKNRISSGDNGTSSGSMTSGDLVTGKCGTGLDLDGSNDYINVGVVDGLDAAGAATIMCWSYLRSDGRDHWLAGRGATSTDATTMCFFADDVCSSGVQGSGNTNTYCFNVGNTSNAGNKVNGATNARSLDTWNHVVGVINGTTRRLYVNGSQNASHTSGDKTAIDSSAESFWLGSWDVTDASTDGIVDEYQMHKVERASSWLAFEYGITNGSFWTNSGWTGLGSSTKIAAIAAYYRRLRGAA